MMKAILGIVILYFGAPLGQALADDTEANVKYLTSLEQVTCDAGSDCQSQFGLYLNSYKVPSSASDLLPYEAGMIEFMCSRGSYSDPRYTGLKWACLARGLNNSKSAALNAISKKCGNIKSNESAAQRFIHPTDDSNLQIPCFEEGLKPIYSVSNKAGADQSCEQKLSTLQQQLTLLNPSVSTSTELKRSIDAIIKEVKSNSFSGEAK